MPKDNTQFTEALNGSEVLSSQSHRNLVFLTTSEEGTLPYSGLCNIILTAEIAQDVGKWLLGGFSHRAKKQCKCDWNIVVCTLHLVSANVKLNVNDKTLCILYLDTL